LNKNKKRVEDKQHWHERSSGKEMRVMLFISKRGLWLHSYKWNNAPLIRLRHMALCMHVLADWLIGGRPHNMSALGR